MSADVLVNNWSGWSPAAFDLTVTFPLTPLSLSEASVTSGTAALVAEQRKHLANDYTCHTLDWTCIPQAVECNGNRGSEARQAFLSLASCLSFSLLDRKSKIVMDLYGKLNTTLVRCNSRALLAGSMSNDAIFMLLVCFPSAVVFQYYVFIYCCKWSCIYVIFSFY